MKVLLVNKLYHPSIGGVETVVRQYASWLAAAGHDVTVLCVSWGFSLRTERSEIDGVKVVRCSSLGTWLSMPCSLSFPFRLLSMAGGFDLVHFHEPFPLGSLCSLFLPKPQGRRFKMIATWHSDIVRQRLFKGVAQLFQRRLLSLCDMILATSKEMALNSGVLPAFKGKIEVLPLSIDPSAYVPAPAFEGLPPGSYILSMGRLAGYKGIPVLLEAFAKARVPEGLKLAVAGSGAMAKAIEERLARPDLRGRVVFINRKISEEEKRSLLANCLFFAFPSTLPTEAFGITQLEAMAYGKPVLNTSLPTGVPWVSLHGESGLTVPPSDVAALSGAIERLASDSALRETLGQGARRRLDMNFSDDAVKALYLSLAVSLFKA